MGWGNWLKLAGAAAATGLTGGAAAPLLVGQVGQVLGEASAGKKRQRAGENVEAQNQALAAQRAQFDAGNLDLHRKGFTEQARGSRARQALIASMLGGHQPTRISVPGITPASIGGGLRLGDVGRQSMAELARQALLAQRTPDVFAGGQLLEPPKLKKASKFEKFLDIAGLAASTYGALGGGGGAKTIGNRGV